MTAIEFPLDVTPLVVPSLTVELPADVPPLVVLELPLPDCVPAPWLPGSCRVPPPVFDPAVVKVASANEARLFAASRELTR